MSQKYKRRKLHSLKNVKSAKKAKQKDPMMTIPEEKSQYQLSSQRLKAKKPVLKQLQPVLTAQES